MQRKPKQREFGTTEGKFFEFLLFGAVGFVVYVCEVWKARSHFIFVLVLVSELQFDKSLFRKIISQHLPGPYIYLSIFYYLKIAAGK